MWTINKFRIAELLGSERSDLSQEYLWLKETYDETRHHNHDSGLILLHWTLLVQRQMSYNSEWHKLPGLVNHTMLGLSCQKHLYFRLSWEGQQTARVLLGATKQAQLLWGVLPAGSRLDCYYPSTTWRKTASAQSKSPECKSCLFLYVLCVYSSKADAKHRQSETDAAVSSQIFEQIFASA